MLGHGVDWNQNWTLRQKAPGSGSIWTGLALLPSLRQASCFLWGLYGWASGEGRREGLSLLDGALMATSSAAVCAWISPGANLGCCQGTWAWKTPVCREGSMITTAESKVRVVRPSPCILEHSKDVFNSFLSYQKYKWLMVLPAAGKKELQIHDDVNKSGRISIFLRRFVLYPVNTVSTPKQLRDILAF